jgi:hypothetical protein
MKKIFGLTAISLFALAGANVQADDLTVRGSIVPGSCSLNIPVSFVDYGRLSISDLSPVDYTGLEKLTTPFSISCDGPTLVGLSAADNREASKKHEAMEVINPGFAAAVNSFGLGANADGDKIGAYALHIRNSTVDGNADFRTILKNGEVWMGASDLMRSQPRYILSWSSGNESSPYLLTNVTGELEIQAAINNTTELAVRDELQIDGSATLELSYI